MTHGFDDSGRKFDAKGQLNDWWTAADAKEFEARAAKYGEQFGNFTLWLPEGQHINPKLTMGENIADLGGLGMAIDAYRSTLSNGASAPNNDAMEGVRRVFFGFAQVWRGKLRDDALTMALASDPHSPASARVCIPTRNMGVWYQAFNVTNNSSMYLAESDRVEIWGPTLSSGVLVRTVSLFSGLSLLRWYQHVSDKICTCTQVHARHASSSIAAPWRTTWPRWLASHLDSPLFLWPRQASAFVSDALLASWSVAATAFQIQGRDKRFRIKLSFSPVVRSKAPIRATVWRIPSTLMEHWVHAVPPT